jgi:hypothetical protein
LRELRGERVKSEAQVGVTIDTMTAASIAVQALDLMFFLGLAGSAVVVLISFVEDAKELTGDE